MSIPPSVNPPVESLPLRWLFLDLNSYFASVEQQDRPELRGRPIAVVPLMADTTCCIAASYEAKAYGVKTGTMVGQARTMCPQIEFVEARHELYVKYHEDIVDAVDSCVPVHAVVSIDEMACRLLGRERDESRARQIALEVKQAIKKVGSTLRCSVGIAPNRFLAKTATDMQKPDGLVVIRSSDLPQILYRLKPQDLCGIGRRMNQRLLKQGIYTMEQICNLSMEEMKRVWNGIVGERYWQWLRGEDLEKAESEQKSVSHSHVLPPQLRNRTDAEAVLQKLLTKAAMRLRKMDFWTRRIVVFIRYLEAESWAAQKKLTECRDTLTLLQAFHSIWQQAPQGKPYAVGVALCDLVPPTMHELNLFESTDRAALDEKVDHINLKYGPNKVYFGGVHTARDAAPTRIAFTSIPDFIERADFD